MLYMIVCVYSFLFYYCILCQKWRNKTVQSNRILTHWGRVTHICVGGLAIIGSDNGLSPERRQAIIWTNAGILLIEPLGTNFSVILIGIQIFSFKKMPLKMSSAKWRPFCLGLNVLKGRKQLSAGKIEILWYYMWRSPHGLSSRSNFVFIIYQWYFQIYGRGCVLNMYADDVIIYTS